MSDAMPADREMTVTDVAARLKVSDAYVYAQLRSNRMPGKRIARKWRITESDYQEFLSSHHSPLVREKNAAGLSKRSQQRLARGQI